MDLEIYAAKENKKEPVRLKLCQEHLGISVIAVDSRGNKVRGGNLIKFLPTGNVVLYRGVNSDLGFKLTPRGKIKLT